MILSLYFSFCGLKKKERESLRVLIPALPVSRHLVFKSSRKSYKSIHQNRACIIPYVYSTGLPSIWFHQTIRSNLLSNSFVVASSRSYSSSHLPFLPFSVPSPNSFFSLLHLTLFLLCLTCFMQVTADAEYYVLHVFVFWHFYVLFWPNKSNINFPLFSAKMNSFHFIRLFRIS